MEDSQAVAPAPGGAARAAPISTGARAAVQIAVRYAEVGEVEFELVARSDALELQELAELFGQEAMAEAALDAVRALAAAAGLEEERDAAVPPLPEDKNAVARKLVWIGVLNARKKDLRRSMAEVEEQLDEAHASASSSMAALGLAATRLPDGTRAVLRPALYCNKVAGVPSEAVVGELLAAGLRHLLTYSPPKLKAVTKENMDALPVGADKALALPEPVRAFFSVYQKDKVTVTPGSAVAEEYERLFPTDGSQKEGKIDD